MLHQIGVDHLGNCEEGKGDDDDGIGNDVGVFLDKPDSLNYIRRQVRSCCYRMNLGDHFSEDIVQDVYVKVLNGRAKFRGDSAVSTWVNRIVHNECVNKRKRETLAAKWIEPIEPEHDPPESESNSDDLVLKLQVAAAKEFIRAHHPGLPMKILAALESEGPLSARELADLLGRGKSAIHEALAKKLRPVFEDLVTFPATRQKVKKTSSSGSR